MKKRSNSFAFPQWQLVIFWLGRAANLNLAVFIVIGFAWHLFRKLCLYLAAKCHCHLFLKNNNTNFNYSLHIYGQRKNFHVRWPKYDSQKRLAPYGATPQNVKYLNSCVDYTYTGIAKKKLKKHKPIKCGEHLLPVACDFPALDNQYNFFIIQNIYCSN